MARGQGKRAKQPVAVKGTNKGKLPRVAAPPPTFRGGVISWRFNAVDKEGPFSWADLENCEKYQEVIQHLAQVETMSEASLREGGSHFIAVEKLSKPATDRLMELKLDDIDELYSIRVTGKNRVFCVHRHKYMRLLWWDPDHAVCPSLKR